MLVQDFLHGQGDDDRRAALRTRPRRIAFQQTANVAQAFGHHAQAWAKHRIRLTSHVAFRCPIRDATATFSEVDILQSCDRFDPSARPFAISTSHFSLCG